MKKFLIILMCCALLIGCKSNGSKPATEPEKEVTPVSEEKQEKEEELYKGIEYTANLEDYKVPEDLKTLKGYDMIFGDMDLSPDQDKIIRDNGFFLGSTDPMEKIFSIYEKNQYMYVPNFVTSDLPLYLYHVLYSNVLKASEKNLLVDVEDISKTMMEESLNQYEGAKDDKVKIAALKNAAMFGTACTISDENFEVPKEIKDIVATEIANIKSEAPGTSAITEDNVDYSMFKVRGHYTESEELKKYFKVMTCFSQFGLKLQSADLPVENNVIQTMLVGEIFTSNQELQDKYKNLNSFVEFMVDGGEDIDAIKAGEIFAELKLSTNDLGKEENIKKAYERLLNEKPPTIRPYEGINFAFFPQKAILDNIFAQNLLDIDRNSKRPVYSGKDIAATFGNEYAEELVKADSYNKIWEKFPERFEEGKKLAKTLTSNDYAKSMARLQIFAINGFNEMKKEGFPTFMKSEAWKAKELYTYLASWAQLKHDTLLYAKQAGAECGGFEAEQPVGYVEPSIEVYSRLNFALNILEERVNSMNVLSERQMGAIKKFKDFNDFLIACSKKELAGEDLSQEDIDRINLIGGEVEDIYLDINEVDADDYESYFALDEKDRVTVADLMRTPTNQANVPANKILEVGSGFPRTIYVVYNVNGELRIGCGAVMTYYEFLSDERLDDDQFSKMISPFDENIEPKDQLKQPDFILQYVSEDNYF